MANLQKKMAYYKEILGEADDAQHTESSDEEEEDHVDEIVPKKKNFKTQRKGVSAEVFGAHNKKEDFVPKVVPKSAETKQALRTRLLEAFMFSALDKKELEIVIDAIEEVSGKAGEAIIKEGDEGDCMYVLEKGSLNCTKLFAGNSEPTLLKTYVPGEGFGELALLYNAPRAATITSTSDYIAWRVDRSTFNHIVKDAAARKREKYDNFLQSVEIL